MEDEDYESDSTVLLTDYFEQPEKIDAKRRRLSKQSRANKYEDDEEDNTALDGASDNTRTNDSQKQNNNVDKNLLLTKYLTGQREVRIESNDQQIYPVTQHLNKLLPKELEYDGRNSIRNANFDNDDVICLDTDDEEQIDDENEETQNENVINAGVHKVHRENNNSTENLKKYGKLKVLKPAAINARRATFNIFDWSTLVDDCGDSFRVNKNKDTIEVAKPSAITARRATTCFEERWVNTKERKNVSKNYNIQSKKRKNDSNNIYNKETEEADETNAINITNITGQSDDKLVTSGAITVDTNNLKSNTNKPFRNEDKISSEPKRARNETVTKCTQQLQLKNSIIDNNIENKENENLNKSHSEQEKAEACKEPQTSLEVFNSKTLGKIAKQVSFRLQDKAMRREVQCDQQASEARELTGTSKAENQHEIREVCKGDVINKPHDKLQNKQEVNTGINESHYNLQNKQEICNVRNEKVINKSHDKQNKTIVQGDQEISTVQDKQETNVEPDKQGISVVQNDQEICRARNEEVINESHDKQNKTIVHGDQEMSTLQNIQEICRARNLEVINESHDKQNKTIVQGYQEMSTVQAKQETNVLPDEKGISTLQNDQEICRVRNVAVINESQDKQNKTIMRGDQEMSTVQDMQETNVVPDEQGISTLQKDQEICRTRNEEVINESHDKQNKTILQGDQGMSTVQDMQETNVVLDEQGISAVQNDQEICRAPNEEVINESHDKQNKTILQGDQKITTVQDTQETNVVPDEQEICRARKEKVINKSQNKQEYPELQDKQGKSVVPGEHDICKVRNEQVTNESHEKQKNTEVQVEQEISKAYNEQVINDAYDKQDKHKVQSEQEMSTTQDQNVIIETRDKQETFITPEEQRTHQAYNEQEKDMVHNDDMSRINDMQGTSEVLQKELTSDKVNKSDKQFQHMQKTNKVYNEPETKKINDEQKTSGVIKEMEKHERNETRRKLSPGGDKRLMLKFQVQFFSLVSRYITKGYPESALVLHSLIQTLKTDANNGLVQTDVKFGCPKCRHVSTYSSHLLNNTDGNENIASADDFQKCTLCQTLTKLHISFMKRYLEEVTNGPAENQIKNEVNNVPPKLSDVNVETLPKNEPVITKRRVSNQCMIDSKRKKFIAEHNDAQHLTNLNMSPSKDKARSSNFQNNVFSKNQNKVLAVHQANNKPYDERQNKVIILSVQDITPRNDSGVDSEKYNGDSNVKTVTNYVRKLTNENTPDNLTNNFQTKTTRNEKLPDSNVESESNLIAVVTAEEGSEKDSKKANDNVNELGSEKASSTLDGQKTGRVNHNVNEEAGMYKPGDNISEVAPSERPENENDSDPNIENTNSKENDNSNENTLKSLENSFTKLKNNANTKQTENKKAKAHQETTTATSVSATNQDNSLDIQPNCNINKITDVKYICKFCSCEYVQAGRLLRHMKTNHNAKDLTIPENCIRRKCVFCNESMNNKNYNKHVKKYHPDKFTENVATNENSGINEDGSGIMENDRAIPRSNNEMSKTSESSSYKYLCSICEEILTSDYASRQHRKEKHSEYRNQPIYKKVIIKGEDGRDGIHNDEKKELSAEDNILNMSSKLATDNDADSLTKKIYGRCSTNPNKVQNHTKNNEARSRIDVNHNQEAHNGQSSSTTSEIVGRNENNNMNEGSDHITKDASKYKYQCSICNEVLSNYYASRLHRKQNHPEFKYRQIYKKVTIKGKDHDDEELDAEDTSDESEDHGEVVTCVKEVKSNGPTNNKHFQDKTKENGVGSTNNTKYKQNARADNFGTTSANTVGRNDSKNNVAITEASTYKFHCSICDEILNNDYASRKHRKQKHPELRRRQIYRKVILKGKEEQDGGELSSSADSDLDDNEESSGDDENLICNDNDHVTSDADEEGIEASDGNESDDTYTDNNMLNDTNSTQHAHIYTCALCKQRFPSYYAARKHRLEKHANMNRAHLIIKIPDDAATGYDQSSKGKESNQLPLHDGSRSSDDEEIEYDNDKSVPPRYCEKEENNGDEAIKASDCTIKNKSDRIVKHVGNEKEASAQPDLNEEKSNQEAGRKQSDDQIENITSNSANNSSGIDEASEGESVKVSERTAKEKKERITKLFGDDIYVSIQPNKTDCEQEVKTNNTRNTNNLKPTDDESKTKDVHFSEENVERESNDENTTATSVDGNCYKATEASELTINGTNKIDISDNTGTNVQNDDQKEIDMIDCFLEELNREQSQTIQNKNSENESNDDPATTASQINDGEIQSGEEDQFQTENFSVKMPDETFLDNIKITNVISIGAKLYIYVCQECLYATGDYDTVIRHCQNHYNNIEDPVTYCQICQINYDTTCFEQHKSSHDKYLKSVKINFSYKWLFANWQRVFENIDMGLTDAEEMQVKSIYNTFCVKMAVKRDGPWQTALYLCCKCNTCVPPRAIGRHVQQTCQLMNFPCSICNYAFLTDDVRRHHEIYHTDNESKQFKIVVFNDKDDDSFNSKLFQAKAIVKSEETQGVTDIFKCTCSLCFISLKNLKLHFVECEEHTNNGITCPDCTIMRNFLPAELATHRSLHHGAAKYEFKIHRIVIQEETNINSEAECNIPDPEIENGALAEIEDLNEYNDLLKDETFTQTSNEVGSQDHPESIERTENNLAVRKDMTKDESLTQNTYDNDGQRYLENLELNEEDLAVKREMLKTETLTQTSNQEDSQKDQESVKINEEDLAVKRDMLKDETLTQTTNEDFDQRDSNSVELNEENTAFESDMSKDETLIQTAENEDLESVDINEVHLAVERHTFNDESFRQDTNDNNNQSNSESHEFEEENLDVQRDTLNAETLTQVKRDPEFVELSDNEDDVAMKSQEIMDVDVSEPPIPIDDSDSDIELIE